MVQSIQFISAICSIVVATTSAFAPQNQSAFGGAVSALNAVKYVPPPVKIAAPKNDYLGAMSREAASAPAPAAASYAEAPITKVANTSPPAAQKPNEAPGTVVHYHTHNHHHNHEHHHHHTHNHHH